mgnify:CR=1 FL=1
MHYLKGLYIFFSILALTIFFFSTTKVKAKAFEINNIEISKPFENNFNKNSVINIGFRKAFFELINTLVKSNDLKKIDEVKLTEIQSMVESFSIKEEKFVNQVYYVNLGVSFDKKKIFNYLEKKNILPSIPVKRKLLFIPIIIDENKKELLIFSNNKIYSEWNNYIEDSHLIEYILPTEDLEDLNLIKKRYEFIEEYDFKEILNKYYLEDSIITLFFKNDKETRILSRILIKNDIILKNQSYSIQDLNNEAQIKELILNLKSSYEDYWKKSNQINTSIKLPLNIKVNHKNNLKISKFEKVLNETDLIYNFFISKFDKNFTYYKIIFNGTPNTFLKKMSDKNHSFNTQNKIWILQ